MVIDELEVIAARLKALRRALGYEQAKDFANAMGILYQSWNHYELGRRRITLDEAMKVITKTGVTLDWIYLGLDHTLPVHVADKLRDDHRR